MTMQKTEYTYLCDLWMQKYDAEIVTFHGKRLEHCLTRLLEINNYKKSGFLYALIMIFSGR